MSDAEMQEEELEVGWNNILMDAIMIMIMMTDHHAEYADGVEMR